MSECINKKGIEHHHRGKSSERFLDKNDIIKVLNISEGQVILDAGCGNGYMSKEFARLLKGKGKVYALDPDEIVIKELKESSAGENIEPFTGDITKETKLEKETIDFIYLSTVLHGFSQVQMEGFVKEVKRLLKPGGTLAILEIKKEETPFGPPMNIRLSPEDLKAKISFTPEKAVGIGEYFYLQLFKK